MSLRLHSASDKPAVSGDFNFKFSVDLKLESSGTVSAIIAQAFSPSGIPVPIKCKWRRILKERTYTTKANTAK